MATQSVKAYQYIQAFSCLAERCEDTCCQNWPIAVTQHWVDTHARDTPPLLDLIARDSDAYQIRKNEQQQCVALHQGRCSVHATRGESALPDICATYPRMYRRINDMTIKSASMSCPEVTRLVLFGTAPFQLQEQQEDDLRFATSRISHADGLDARHWANIVNLLNDMVLTETRSSGDILVQLLELARHLQTQPHGDWSKAAATFNQNYCPVPAEVTPLISDPLLLVLFEIGNAPFVPQNLRDSVMAAIDIEPGETAQQNRVTLKTAVRRLAHSPANAVLEPVLKRFIAAEMTRTGFPFISTTSAGQDYGTTLGEWAATLAIRTLALRYLLLAHCHEQRPKIPDRQQIVDRVYRYCRAVSHNSATTSEKMLRQQISQRGPAYLLALTRQTGEAAQPALSRRSA